MNLLFLVANSLPAGPISPLKNTAAVPSSSRKLTVVHQLGLTGTKTVQTKLRFERKAALSVGPNPE
jgi:hypothetical protein